MKIAILDDYQDVVKSLTCFALLDGNEVTVYTDTAQSVDELVDRLADKEAIVLIRERTVVDRNLVSRLPNLRLISQTGKISKHIDLAACSEHGVDIAEGAGSPVATSELCWALILAASRHLVPYAANLRRGRWQDSGPLGLGRTLNGLTMGIWGYGKIGTRVAQFARAFGMQVLVWGSEASRSKAVADGFAAAASKQDLFSRSDVLSLHLRLVPATRGCVTYADLESMKEDALFVNTSRAELVAEGALVRSLQGGRPGSAAVDVFDREPVMTQDEPLLSLPNALCVPHLGYVEKNSYELYFRIAFENIVNYFQGNPKNLVKPGSG
jgi:D-3-phosphoglycerate dehydrogenase